MGQGPFMVSHPCPSCEGQGWILIKPCPGCRGEGVTFSEKSIKIDVPRGAYHGLSLRIPGQGEVGLNGSRGDFLLIIKFLRDVRFNIHNHWDLTTEIEISLETALLGGSVQVPTPLGMKEASLEGGIQPEQPIRFRGEGLYRQDQKTRGDFIAICKIRIPKRDTEEFNNLKEKMKSV